MRRLLVFLVLLFVFVSVSSLAFAQEDTNACLTGGSREGRCDFPTDAEDEWAWTCGYYVGLFDNGEIPADAIPDWCYYPQPDAGVSFLCEAHSNFILADKDVQLVGPLNTSDNMIVYLSGDGSCSGDIYGSLTLVQAADRPQARVVCAAISPIWINAVSFPVFGYSDTWVCTGGA